MSLVWKNELNLVFPVPKTFHALSLDLITYIAAG